MRKSTLLGLIGGAVLGLYVDGAQLFADDKPIASRPSRTEADKYLDDFPEKIPGAKEVRKWKIEGSRYCLVHVRQKHIDPFGENSEQALRSIATVQSNIYTIVDYLAREKGLKYVRLEGIFTQKKGGDIDADVKKDYDSRLRKIGKKYELAAGGAERLVVEGKVHAKPTETPEFWRGFARIIGELDDRGKLLYQMDKREDAVLELIDKEGEASSVLVYGGRHAFGGEYKEWTRDSEVNNVAEWNKKHPEKIFSWAEVDPLGYDLDGK